MFPHKFKSHHIQIIVALTLTCLSANAQPTQTPTVAPVVFTTYAYGNARLGWNARETQLAPQNVNAENFGPHWKTKLDGGVYGATLVVNDLQFDGRKRRVVFAATERNAVYAFNTNSGCVLRTTRQLDSSFSEVVFRGWWSRKINGVLSTSIIEMST